MHPRARAAVVVPTAVLVAGYDTSRCIPEPHEIALYRQRIQRTPLPALESIRAEARARGSTVSTAAEAERWLRDSTTGGVQRMLDMRLFADYNPAAGVQARSPRDLGAISARSRRDLGARKPRRRPRTPSQTFGQSTLMLRVLLLKLLSCRAQIAALRAFNLPNPGLSFGIISLAPPGRLYAAQPKPVPSPAASPTFPLFLLLMI